MHRTDCVMYAGNWIKVSLKLTPDALVTVYYIQNWIHASIFLISCTLNWQLFIVTIELNMYETLFCRHWIDSCTLQRDKRIHVSTESISCKLNSQLHNVCVLLDACIKLVVYALSNCMLHGEKQNMCAHRTHFICTEVVSYVLYGQKWKYVCTEVILYALN